MGTKRKQKKQRSIITMKEGKETAMISVETHAITVHIQIDPITISPS